MDLYFVWAVDGGSVVASPFAGGLGGPEDCYEMLDESLVIDPPTGALPRLYLLEIDEGYVASAEASAPLELVRIRVRHGSLQFKFLRDGDWCGASPELVGGMADPQEQARLLSVIPNKVGLDGERLASSLLAWAPASTQLAWIVRGGRQAWVEDQQAEVARRKLGKQFAEMRQRQETLRQRQETLNRVRISGAGFINPYTFVPLPSRVERRQPRGHDAQDESGLSGWFDLELNLRTPLLLPQDNDPHAELPLLYAGSSIRGSIRAIHAVLADGCLRGVDGEAVPIHREAVKVDRRHDRLARVTRIDAVTKAVTEVELTEEPVWVPATIVREAFAHGIDSGQLLDLDNTSAQRVGTRLECRSLGAVTAGTGWIAHVTDPAARREDLGYLIAVGRLTGSRLQVSEKMWQEFKDASAGTRDTQVAQQTQQGDTAVGWGSPDWPGEDVTFLGPREYHNLYIGRRRRADGWLGVGDSVWITDGGKRLKMASAWRAEGKHVVRTRLPDSAPAGHSSLEPCRDPENLCPTCAVFGSIDALGDERSRQAGYASHVRFGPARPVGEANIGSVDLPPLRSPRISAGAFYLEHRDNQDRGYDKERQPRGQWGSSADKPLRQIAGRKFYWHGQTTSPDGRHHRRQHSEDPPRSQLASGTRLTARVWFENLDLQELGMLLMACQPGLVLGGMKPVLRAVDGTEAEIPPSLDPVATDLPLAWQRGRVPDDNAQRYPLHLGGGKPLGYGSVAVTVVPETFRVTSSASRYGSAPAPAVSIVELVESCAESRTQPEVPTTWAALRRVLSWDAVDAERIWYPTVDNFNHRPSEAFDHSYEFFTRYSGAHKKGKDTYPYEYLPRVMDWSQFLPRGDS